MNRTPRRLLLSCLGLVALLTFASSKAEAARYHLRYRTERFFERNLSQSPTHAERGTQYYNRANQPKVTTTTPVAPVSTVIVPSPR